jgi:hypothetical protein
MVVGVGYARTAAFIMRGGFFMVHVFEKNFHDVIAVAQCVSGVSTVGEILPITRGHLNRTFKVQVDGLAHEHLLLQQINHRIFQDIPALMRNITLVLNHLETHTLFSGEVPQLQRFQNGDYYFSTLEFGWWRAYKFIEGSESFDNVPTPNHAESGASLCGSFSAALTDLDPGELTEVLPGFQDSRARFESGDAAAYSASKERLANAHDVTIALEQRRATALRWQTPEVLKTFAFRPVHNDFKLNNVLFRQGTAEACAVIDLDSCMPGYVYYDFGDLLRSTLLSCPEDCTNLSLVTLNEEVLAATVRGFVRGLGSSVSDSEKRCYYDAPAALAYTLARRFLTDYLENDSYFGASWPDQNLQRARVQLAHGDLLAEKYQLIQTLLDE